MVPRGDHLRSLSLMQLEAEQRIECYWHLFLRWFYEVGASRLAIRGQPLPSKPIIPVHKYYIINQINDLRISWLFGSCRGDLSYHAKSQRTNFLVLR